MKPITIQNTFVNASGGNAAVQIQGAGVKIDYVIFGSDTRKFDLPDGVYTIKVSGATGGDLELKVSHHITLLLQATDKGPAISIIDTFTV